MKIIFLKGGLGSSSIEVDTYQTTKELKRIGGTFAFLRMFSIKYLYNKNLLENNLSNFCFWWFLSWIQENSFFDGVEPGW